MQHISIKRAFGAGWRSFMRRPWYLFGLSLAFGGMFIFSVGDALVTALAAIVYCGFFALLISHFRGTHVSFDDIIPTNHHWISLGVLILVKTFFVLLGFLCLIVPGVYLSIRWMFAEILVIENGMRPIEALKASSTLTAGVRGKLFWYAVVMLLFNLLGFIFFFIGIFFTSVITALATIALYEELKNKLTEQTTLPLEAE